MSYPVPDYKRSQVDKAGEILASEDFDNIDDYIWAYKVMNNWRACHGYPVNTFQATLRHKLSHIDTTALVAQRIKRAPSIILKLQRFNTMNLSQMQDIGGLRAVVGSINKVRQLENDYRKSKFKHKLYGSNDYIETPKSDGYRSLHLKFKYQNERAKIYNNLSVELQIRTYLQHSWATAVETMGTFLGQALKSNRGDKRWLEFFEVASASFAHIEGCSLVPGYSHLSKESTFDLLLKTEQKLGVLDKLRGFSIAANSITANHRPASYHLIVLDSNSKKLQITPYSTAQLALATEDYSKIELRATKGELLDAVLVSAGPIGKLRKAYPNFFLDTHEFIKQIKKISSARA